MDVRKHLIEAGTLVAAAALCALVANAVASNERKLAIPGDYPNARTVPQLAPENSAAPSMATLPQPPSGATDGATSTPSTGAPIASAPTVTATSGSAAGPRSPAAAPPPAASSSKSAASPAPATTKSATTKTAASDSGRQPNAVVPAHAAAADLSRFAPHPDKPYVEIGYDDVAALHAAGAPFFDARRTSVYADGHIAGARSYSVWEADIDQKVNAFYEEHGDPREQGRPIVVYCSGGDCEDSHMLAQKLWGVQFNNVYVYKDGFPDWQKRGGAVHTGSAP